MANPISISKTALSRSIDVQINLSRPSTEIATDMTMICFVSPNLTFGAGNDRIKFFTTMDAVSGAVPQNSEAYFAASAFFSQSPHPLRLAIARVFSEPTKAILKAGTVDLTKLVSIENGAFKIDVNGEEKAVKGLTFDANPTMNEVVATLQSALTSVGCTAELSGDSFMITTSQAGDGQTLSFAKSPEEGTDVSELLALTEALADSNTIGYTPGDLVSELNLIKTAARQAGYPIYGWVLDRKYRDTEDQKAVSDWAEANTPSFFSACTNASNAYNSGNRSNIGFYAQEKGNKRTAVMYHHNPQLYPDMSYIAYALTPNYAGTDTAITMKFKEMPGIEPSPLEQTDVDVLASRNINCYVAVGNNSREIRPGTQSANNWFTDSLVNLDNYVEELQV